MCIICVARRFQEFVCYKFSINQHRLSPLADMGAVGAQFYLQVQESRQSCWLRTYRTLLEPV